MMKILRTLQAVCDGCGVEVAIYRWAKVGDLERRVAGPPAGWVVRRGPVTRTGQGYEELCARCAEERPLPAEWTAEVVEAQLVSHVRRGQRPEVVSVRGPVVRFFRPLDGDACAGVLGWEAHGAQEVRVVYEGGRVERQVSMTLRDLATAVERGVLEEVEQL